MDFLAENVIHLIPEDQGLVQVLGYRLLSLESANFYVPTKFL